jgi:polyhydroxybutyrate depolymerase
MGGGAGSALLALSLLQALGGCADARNRELLSMSDVISSAAGAPGSPSTPPGATGSPVVASMPAMPQAQPAPTPVAAPAGLAGAGASDPTPSAQSGAAGAPGVTAPMPGSPGSSDPRPSEGCSGGSLAPGESTGAIDSAGGMRDYILFVPSGYDGKTPLPLVLDLHGLTSSASAQAQLSGFRPQAETENYVYLAPNGIDNMWSDRGPDSMDITFLRELLADVEARGCIDLRRVYSTGCSNGGSMTNLMMCSSEDIIAAVAPVCGTTFFDLESECMLDRPISTMLVIGRQDTLNCWESGGGMGGIGVTCVKDYQAAMVTKNGCKGMPTETAGGVCESVGECEGGTEVVICGPEIGHVAYSTTEMDVAKEAWTFLKKFYLP